MWSFSNLCTQPRKYLIMCTYILVPILSILKVSIQNVSTRVASRWSSMRPLSASLSMSVFSSFWVLGGHPALFFVGWFATQSQLGTCSAGLARARSLWLQTRHSRAAKQKEHIQYITSKWFGREAGKGEKTFSQRGVMSTCQDVWVVSHRSSTRQQKSHFHCHSKSYTCFCSLAHPTWSMESARSFSFHEVRVIAGQMHEVYGGYRSERGTFSEDWRCCLEKRRRRRGLRHMTNKWPTHYLDSTEVDLFTKLTQSRHTSPPFIHGNWVEFSITGCYLCTRASSCSSQEVQSQSQSVLRNLFSTAKHVQITFVLYNVHSSPVFSNAHQ